MAMNSTQKLQLLRTHVDALNAAGSFEEYKRVHIAYVQFLIDEGESFMAAATKYTDAVCKNETIWVEAEEGETDVRQRE